MSDVSAQEILHSRVFKAFLTRTRIYNQLTCVEQVPTPWFYSTDVKCEAAVIGPNYVAAGIG